MAKKSLADAASSKLSQSQDYRHGDARSLVRPRKVTPPPRSYRFNPVQIDRLNRLSEQLSMEAGRNISQTDVLKGLLILGERTKTDKVIAAIKDAIFEAD